MKIKMEALVYDHEHFKMSEALGCKLEAKLDEISKQGDFYAYFNGSRRLKAIIDDRQYLKLLNERAVEDEMLARSVCMAIKNWYGMCKNHRLFVINKFYSYCNQSKLISIFFIKADYTLAFCDFFIKEFTSILSDDQWKAVAKYHRAGFVGKLS